MVENTLFVGLDVGASYCPSGDVLIKTGNFAEDREISGVLTAVPRHRGGRCRAAGQQAGLSRAPWRRDAARREHAAGHHSVGCRSAHLQSFGSFVDRDLTALSPFALAIDWNAVRVSKTADMSARPAGTMRRRLSRTIQDGGDCVIWQLPRPYANQIDNTGVDRPSGMADFVLLDFHISVIAALPMDDKRQGITDDIDDNFLDEQPDDLLARFD